MTEQYSCVGHVAFNIHDYMRFSRYEQVYTSLLRLKERDYCLFNAIDTSLLKGKNSIRIRFLECPCIAISHE